MYIYQKKQSSDLYHDLKAMGRNNFSYEGANALMEFIQQQAEESGCPIEYDPIAFCCTFTEYDSLHDVLQDYSSCKTLEEIRENTDVIEVPNSSRLIIAEF